MGNRGALGVIKLESGGSAWESNPPKTRSVPPDGFEVRGAHRDSSAPPRNIAIHYTMLERDVKIQNSKF
jgi:hypothetical protein